MAQQDKRMDLRDYQFPSKEVTGGYLQIELPIAGKHFVPAEVEVVSVGSKRGPMAAEIGAVSAEYPSPTEEDPEDPLYLSDERVEAEWKARVGQPHPRPHEKIEISFILRKVSRGFTHQLVRNRVGWSYAQQSLRWVNIERMEVYKAPLFDESLYAPPMGRYSDEALNEQAQVEGLTPDDLRGVIAAEMLTEYFDGIPIMVKDGLDEDPRVFVARYVWDDLMERIQKAYKYCTGSLTEYLEDGGKPQPLQNATQDIRGMLPTNILTNIYCSTNLLGLINAAKMRLCHAAQQEIRYVFQEIKRQVTLTDPSLGKHIKIICQHFGFCPQMQDDKDKCTLPLSKKPAPRELNKVAREIIDGHGYSDSEKLEALMDYLDSNERDKVKHDQEAEAEVMGEREQVREDYDEEPEVAEEIIRQSMDTA